ncbi:MAG: hypothetical protein WC254_06675 [Candidatus Woesearchaeota archaeon]|jgi:hypothetical protein
MKTQNKPHCCQSKDENQNNETKGLKQGIVYGLIPHIGCIVFLLLSILGVTTATAFFRPLLASSYIFYGLIGMSLVFATLSAVVYLKRLNMLSVEGIKAKSQYLMILFGTTVFINIFLFMVVFPYTANINFGNGLIGSTVASDIATDTLSIAVDIPCTGHASLIKQDIMALTGVSNVEFKSPNIFTVSYDAAKVSQQQILALEIFQSYAATIV